MQGVTAYVAIGSNVGDRAAHLGHDLVFRAAVLELPPHDLDLGSVHSLDVLVAFGAAGATAVLVFLMD